MKEEISARINTMRDYMRSAGIDAVIIPQTDPHQGEYLADHWQVRRWLSGFTGSAGDLVITMSEAFVWADSRYWLQAANQLSGTGIGVMEEGKPEVPSILGYLGTALKPGSTVGIDGMLFSIDKTREMEQELTAHGMKLRVDFNPVDLIWLDRPALPKAEVFVHEQKYAGQTMADKIAAVLANVNAAGADATFISDLAEIAWTLNIRARDVECNPVVTSFLYISPGSSTLFIDADKLNADTGAYLASNGVNVRGYDEVLGFLATLPESQRVLVSSTQSAGALLPALGSRAVVGKSPVAMLKAVKNDVQLDGVRNAMVRDGVALVYSFMEIEDKMAHGERLTEMGVADILLRHRSSQPLFFDLSFGTIAGFGPQVLPTEP